MFGLIIRPTRPLTSFGSLTLAFLSGTSNINSRCSSSRLLTTFKGGLTADGGGRMLESEFRAGATRRLRLVLLVRSPFFKLVPSVSLFTEEEATG